MEQAIILQARMGSTRLPGKVLKVLFAEKPMLYFICERLKESKIQLIVATTTRQEDNLIVDFAEKNNILFFRGEENNVLKRYYDCAVKFGVQYIVRATADNPLVEPSLVNPLLSTLIDNNLDYVYTSELPVGCNLQAFTVSMLKKELAATNIPSHLEHVDDYLLENISNFKTKKIDVSAELIAPEMSFTVDTDHQFENAREIYKTYYNNSPIDLRCAIKDSKL